MGRIEHLEAWFVSGIGVVLIGLHLLHGWEEIGVDPHSVLFGVVIPLIASLYIVVSGYQIATTSWSPASPGRIALWCYAGLLTGIGLISLLIPYQASEGVTLSDPLYVMVMFGTYGAAVGVVVGRYDVQRQAERIRQERKSERLDDFASIVSHDLRNPLRVAEGHLELAIEDQEIEHLEGVDRALQRMNRLIEDLLTLAREGESAIKIQRIDFEETVNQSWNNVDTTGANLNCEVDGTIPADPVRLSQVLENLIRNAIEHGGEDVTISIGELDDGFYLEDDGPGIPAKVREKVFDRGYSNTQDGTGFGLAIVKEIVDNHGWEIQITDSEAGGARFEITNIS